MNASGRPNTCKPRGIGVAILPATGARVSNAYATYPIHWDSPEKFGLIPYIIKIWHQVLMKVLAV